MNICIKIKFADNNDCNTGFSKERSEKIVLYRVFSTKLTFNQSEETYFLSD